MASIGPVSTGISGQRYAIPRIVCGVTKSLFLDQADTLLPSLYAFSEPELDPEVAAMFSSMAIAADG